MGFDVASGRRKNSHPVDDELYSREPNECLKLIVQGGNDFLCWKVGLILWCPRAPFKYGGDSRPYKLVRSTFISGEKSSRSVDNPESVQGFSLSEWTAALRSLELRRFGSNRTQGDGSWSVSQRIRRISSTIRPGGTCQLVQFCRRHSGKGVILRNQPWHNHGFTQHFVLKGNLREYIYSEWLPWARLFLLTALTISNITTTLPKPVITDQTFLR